MKLSPSREDEGALEEDDDRETVLMRARLTESLSYSFPSGALSKAFANMEPDSDTDPLSNSCFAEIRLDKIKKEELYDDDEDEELTSLSWLQDSDLLKNIKTEGLSICTSPPPEEHKENTLGLNGSTHPPHIPYNPQKHINSKPPYSFSCLIFMAIEDCVDKRLPVKDIYNWILTHFPYFQNAPTGWKNSVRHNLSLNKCFKKVDKEKGSSIGKGSLWMIDPDFRPNLLQALRKTPYHPYHQLQMFNNSPTHTNITPLLPGAPRTAPFTARVTNINSPSPHLFPFLSRRLAQSNGTGPPAVNGGTAGAGNGGNLLESDIDVANTLVSLKLAAESRRPLKSRNGVTNGARSRSPSPPEFGSEREKEILKQKQLKNARTASIVLTSVPSEDHTYSVTPAQLAARTSSPASSIDEPYDFGNSSGGPPAGTADRSTSDMEYSDFDEDNVSDEETEAVYRAAIQRIKLDAQVAHAAVPSITQRIFASLTAAASSLEKGTLVVASEDEEKKIAEGADALLNLAGIKTGGLIQPVSRTASPTVLASHSNASSPAPAAAISPNTANNNNNSCTHDEMLLKKTQAVAAAEVTEDVVDAMETCPSTDVTEEETTTEDIMDQS